jgi:hypothetical protein
MPWLDVYCPGCGTSRAIDLRTVDRHPLASVRLAMFVVPGLGADVEDPRLACIPASGEGSHDRTLNHTGLSSAYPQWLFRGSVLVRPRVPAILGPPSVSPAYTALRAIG